MSDASEQQIRERAYALWEKEGSPEGRDAEFWERAKSMIETEPMKVTQTRGEGDREIDVAMDDTFPASDPPAFTADRGPVKR